MLAKKSGSIGAVSRLLMVPLDHYNHSQFLSRTATVFPWNSSVVYLPVASNVNRREPSELGIYELFMAHIGYRLNLNFRHDPPSCSACHGKI